MNKIDGILEIIEVLEKKGEAHKDSVLANIDALEEEIELAAKGLAENNGVPTEGLVTKVSENLLQKRPLANINMANKKIYKYVSKLGKRIEKLKSYPDRNINFHNIDFDHKALKEAIAEYILYYSVNHRQEKSLKGLDEICEEMGLVDPEAMKDKIERLQDIQEIDKLIKEKNIGEFMKWVTFNETRLINVRSKIPMLAHQLYIINEVAGTKGIERIRDMCKRLSSKFQQNRTQMKQFIAALVFSSCTQPPINQAQDGKQESAEAQESRMKVLEGLTERYRPYLDVELKWKTIEDCFINDICAMYNIPRKNPLFEVFKAGVCNYSKFVNISGIDSYNKTDELDINLDIAKEFTYHNIVVCPVSKDICNSDNPPVLLSCGHVISDASAKKLANISGNVTYKKFKCPVCPAEQTYGRLRVLKIDK